jgi:hypothetical protein
MGVGPVRPQNRPDKKQGEGFLGWSVGPQGFACSLRCFLFRFAFACLSPSLFPPNASVVSQLLIVHGLSRDYPIVELCTTGKQPRISGTFQLSLVWNPVFLSSNYCNEKLETDDR